MGAWIETDRPESVYRDNSLSPACMGAWIETIILPVSLLDDKSPACTGAWIETLDMLFPFKSSYCRPLVRGRGLKLLTTKRVIPSHVARLYGGVD